MPEFFSREQPLLAWGKIFRYFATIMDRNRDSNHQSQNEDNFRNSYASFVLSKPPASSITRKCTLQHEPIVKSSYKNTSGSLGEREMLWEHAPQAGVSTAFSSSPKLSRVFVQLDRNTEYMFSISFRKHHDEKKENNLLPLIIKM